MKYPDVVTERGWENMAAARRGKKNKKKKSPPELLTIKYVVKRSKSSRRVYLTAIFQKCGAGCVHKEHRRSINKAVKQRSACGCVRRLGGRSRCGPVLQLHCLRCARRRLRSSQLRRSSLLPPSRRVLDIVVVYTVLASTPWDIHK